MSEREEHNELIHRLAERLRNHTEPYKDGAWERFAATHGKRRRKLWPYSTAAAVLLAAIGWFWSTRYSNEMPVVPQIAQQEAVVKSAEPDAAGDERMEGTDAEVLPDPPTVPSTADSRTGSRQHLVSEQRRADIPVVEREEALVTDTENGNREADDSQAAPLTASAVAAVDTAGMADPDPQRLAVTVEPGGAATGAASRVLPPPDSERDAERWDLGLVVSPSLTSEAVNIGGGFAVAYRISDKFSIGSGISVAQLGVGENPSHSPRADVALDSPTPSDYFNGHSEMAVNYRREVSMTSSVVTLDIPLDLRYDVAKGFYTSVGLSYVAVLDERRTSHYVDRINKNTFANHGLSTSDRLASTEFVYSSERVAAKPLQGNGYAGFMNFSIGKKLPISSKLFLSVEPYFKLPIGRLSKEEMNFTNGGIRIVTGF